MTDVMKRYAASPRAADAVVIANATYRLLPELVAACEAWEAHLSTTFPPYKDKDSPSVKIAKALAHARELGVTHDR